MRRAAKRTGSRFAGRLRNAMGGIVRTVSQLPLNTADLFGTAIKRRLIHTRVDSGTPGGQTAGKSRIWTGAQGTGCKSQWVGRLFGIRALTNAKLSSHLRYVLLVNLTRFRCFILGML